MKVIIWILVEFGKTFLWMSIFTLSIIGFFIFLTLSLFFKIVVGTIIVLFAFAYLGNVLKKLGL